MIGMSVNMGYLFTDKGVVKMSFEQNDLNGRNFVPYTFESLNIALDIINENFNFKYKTGNISLTEYTSEPRRFLNFLIETLKPENTIKIIQEWETNHGNKLLLINESVDKLLIEQRVVDSWNSIKLIIEQGEWYNKVGDAVKSGAKNVYNYGKDLVKQGAEWVKDQDKLIRQKGFTQWAKESAGKVWGYVKDKIADAWNCAKSGIECIMEGMRKMVFSAGGTAILTGVSAIPVVGQITNGVIFGALLLWDIYKGLTGKGWEYISIIASAIAILAPSLGKIVKTAFAGIKSFAQLGAAAVSKGGIFLKVFNLLKSGIGSLTKLIGQAAKFLGEKLGIKSLQSWGGKVQQKMSQMVDDMAAAAKNTTPKTTTPKPSLKSKVKDIWKKNPKPIPPGGVIVDRMGKSFLLTTGICAALGLDGLRCQQKVGSGEITDEQLKQAQAKAEAELAKTFADDEVTFEL
jgi:hypothetical protein